MPILRFFDNFNRPDSTEVGNGWVDRASSGQWSIANNRLKATNGSAPRVNLIVRPPSAADVLRQRIEVKMPDFFSPAVACVWVRWRESIQGGYRMFVNGNGSALTVG